MSKIKDELQKKTDQANAFQFKPWHIVVGAMVAALAVVGVIKLIG